jgi:signal transduction histidine kinase
VSPTLGQRADEISDLARDFDYMVEQIQSLIDGQRRLLADVSHELRSPLTRLTVALSLARSASNTRTEEYLERSQQEAQRLDQMIGQILMLSRIDCGVQNTECVLADLASMVREVAGDANFESQSRSRGVTFECGAPCVVKGSVEMLRSAIENVVRNAVRHTGERTSVEITLEREGSAALLRVRDHGPGVPESILAEIFLPFRKASPMNGSGTGLGLAIANRAVRAHGGEVSAHNADDGGLVVEITLPLA